MASSWASTSIRTASGPPAARARSPASIHVVRGMRVWAAIATEYHVLRCLDNLREAYIQWCMYASELPGSEHGVHQIEVPIAARALCTLARIHYADAFVLETRHGDDRTPEEWARAILEGAPTA